MTDLLWPGDHRAGDVFSDRAFVAAMIRVEQAWLRARGFDGDIRYVGDLEALSIASEEGGNPVIPLLSGISDAPPELHKGLTSQDVLDTALALCLRDAAARIRDDLDRSVIACAALADRHRHTPMAGRTLTQHAIPITFGLKASGWLQGLLDARDRLPDTDLPIQLGGAAGSLAAPAALAGSPEKTREWVTAAAQDLGLTVRAPWHTTRSPVTAAGDALVTCTDACGHLANDVLLSARPEIHELTESPEGGRGGSSAMPNKQNPVLAILIKRAALAGPPLAATLHAAAAAAVDERPDGSWHVEWATLRTLARRTVVAVSQTAELLSGLRVDAGAMASTLAAARPGIDAEQRKYDDGDGSYRGATDEIIDAALARAAPQRGEG
ncbi:lyase family protein [Actinoplanes sp. NPDC051411]|uniref:lyase family protein n=1 Tax=Actinoplanes sp. NPDC051411 TaxID=3155522 RepID=UPI0034284F7F